MSDLRRAVLGALTLPGMTAPFRPFMAGRATIFMLHRFEDPERGVHGTTPATLRAALGWLRREGYPLIGLRELFTSAAQGRVPSRAVAFTIDDGYREQATVAGPVFAEFDCPVTVFLTSGFLDGRLWFWWDRIEYIFERTRHHRVETSIGDQSWSATWTDLPSRRRVQLELTERCKRIPDAAKHATIARVAAAAEVELPESPPASCAPMSWDEARAAEARGMTFGPHTLTHPILSQTPDAQSREELTGSWQRLTEELRQPDPVFCYPNGGSEDFGMREIDTLRASGMIGAVVGAPGYLDATRFRSSPSAPYLVERFGLPDALPVMAQYAAGVERLKQLVRGR